MKSTRGTVYLTDNVYNGEKKKCITRNRVWVFHGSRPSRARYHWQALVHTCSQWKRVTYLSSAHSDHARSHLHHLTYNHDASCTKALDRRIPPHYYLLVLGSGQNNDIPVMGSPLRRRYIIITSILIFPMVFVWLPRAVLGAWGWQTAARVPRIGSMLVTSWCGTMCMLTRG